MSRITSPWIVGEWWLDKRSDGASREIWQITTYDPIKRKILYKSSKQKSLTSAKAALEVFLENQKAGTNSVKPQPKDDPMTAAIIPELNRYWLDHGRHTISYDTTARSLRSFIAFLNADRVGPVAKFRDLNNKLVERYQAWSMNPHSFRITWFDQAYESRSRGISGATFKRQLAIIKAAIALAVENGVIPSAPFIRPVDTSFVSPLRTRTLTTEELGAIIGYASSDRDLANWISLMLATGARPVAASLFSPDDQYRRLARRVDLHPKKLPLTKKRNPVVPIIPEFERLIQCHVGPWISPTVKVTTLWRRFRLMRQQLGLDSKVFPKTLRHTVATHLAICGASEWHIEAMLGHWASPAYRDRLTNSSRFYEGIVPHISRLWISAHNAADEWRNRFATVNDKSGKTVIIRRARFNETLGNAAALTTLDALSPSQVRLGVVNSSA